MKFLTESWFFQNIASWFGLWFLITTVFFVVYVVIKILQRQKKESVNFWMDVSDIVECDASFYASFLQILIIKLLFIFTWGRKGLREISKPT